MASVRIRLLVVVVALFLPLLLIAQGPPPPLPPAVGNAVLLATNSIQVDRGTVVTSGDLVVNNASPGPYLGEAQLSVDTGVSTPSGFALKADSVDIDDATIAGAVHYNTLQNGGTIAGALVTPLALPVINQLPQLPNRPANANDIVVADGETRIIGTGGGVGVFGNLTVGIGSTVRFPGGPYAFGSITVGRGSSLFFDGPADLVVNGRLSIASDVTIAPGPGITTKRRMFFVTGMNGLDGLLLSTPPAVSIGQNCSVAATIHAPNGSIVAGQSLVLLGSLVARDIKVGRNGLLELRSGFRNLPPVAISQQITTDDLNPVPITLSGFDPDNDPLTFSIVVQPTRGTLGAITPSGPTTAVVVYTPGSRNPDDSFIFRVTDSEGFTANGVITINNGVPPPPPTTVIASNSTVEALVGRPTIVNLPAVAPPGVAIMLSIVPGTGPTNGTLGPLTQPTLMPQRSGSVIYLPAPGYTGPDAFTFRACGVINGNQVCDTGTITINVVDPDTEGEELAQDFVKTVPSNTVVAINLSGAIDPAPGGEDGDGGGGDGGGGRDEGEGGEGGEDGEGGEGEGEEGGRIMFRPGTDATFLRPAAVAGNVADANGDGLGDNVNALPGQSPELMSAGVGQTGGPGSNGTTRMHIEWEIGSIADQAAAMTSATVLLRTQRGESDTLGTSIYFVGTSGDGQLTAGDFEQAAESTGLVMPVPGTPVGSEGLFSFDVLGVLREAMNSGFTHFAIQGRVNEGLEGPANGLHVYTSAEGNGQNVPQLGITTGEQSAARTYRILSLPANGTLRDSSGNLITSVPYALPSAIVFYRSNSGFTGVNTFTYDATENGQSDSGTVTLTVIAGDCSVDPAFCDGGRE